MASQEPPETLPQSVLHYLLFQLPHPPGQSLLKSAVAKC